ncbi:FRG domain-containing protein (plasmid) [Rhizobium leguminosarum]
MKRIEWREWTGFLNEVAEAAGKIGSPEILWYRGVTSGNHTLRPTLVRFANGVTKERELFERFNQIARGSEFGLVEADEWDILFQMQHFGVPTRLLDWSEVFGIAVFFATLASREPNDSHIYVLNPRRLNEKAGKETLLDDFDRKDFRYRSVFWEGKPFKPTVPIALDPVHSNSRLAAQTGRFTVHGVDLRALEEIAPDCVQRVKLPKEAFPAAYEFLRLAGINELRVFPDVGGAAPFIRSLVGLV